jgi:hypothetical protein
MKPLRADLIGIDGASMADIKVTGHPAPVLRLCRALIEAGYDPELPLDAYRGDTLCLRVRSIGAAAKLTVRESCKDGRPRFVKLRGDPANIRGDGSYDAAGSVRFPAEEVA